MLLVVDVGNTQTHFGAFRGEELRRALALCDRAPVDRRRARRGAAQPAGAARLRLRRPRRVDRLLDGARSSSPSGRRWRAATSATRCSPSARARRRAWRSATTTRARSAPTGSSTRSRSASASSGAGGVRRLRHGDDLRRRLRASGEYLGGSLMTGIEISLEALSERGARLPKIDLAPPKQRDRQEHDRRDPLGRRVRLRGRDRRDPAAALRRARRAHRRDRHRRAGGAGGAVLPRRSTRSTTCSR